VHFNVIFQSFVIVTVPTVCYPPPCTFRLFPFLYPTHYNRFVSFFEKLQKLRQDKARGADELVPRLLILIKDEISYLLTVLFKKSLAQGVVPEDWKRASVSPIYKKGNKNIAENYRPVSLTSQCSKLMESIIRDVIVQYLEANQLLKDSQPTTI